MISHPNTKINLGLHVLRKRPDGYHDIETVFVPYFGFKDNLEIVKGDDFSTTLAGLIEKYGKAGCEDNDGVEKLRQGITEDGKCMITIAREEGVDWEPTGDLCVKAYKALDADFGLPPVKIFLEKLSPVGAGLGGGSADAAFTLRMLSEMFGLDLDDGALSQYASRLGSDCAFFVWNRPMLGQGRGEILSPVNLPQLSGLKLSVIVPAGIRVSTAMAYRGVTPRRQPSVAAGIEEENGPMPCPGGPLCGTPGPGDSELVKALCGPAEEWRQTVVNDFEPSVFAAHPQLAEIKRSLYASGAVYAAMSGSGSALFALFRK